MAVSILQPSVTYILVLVEIYCNNTIAKVSARAIVLQSSRLLAGNPDIVYFSILSSLRSFYATALPLAQVHLGWQDSVPFIKQL